MERQQVLIGDNLRLARVDGAIYFICACGQTLGSGDENFKDYCLVEESATASIGAGYKASDQGMADQVCFREFFCPSCGLRQATEIARVGDPYLSDIQPRL